MTKEQAQEIVKSIVEDLSGRRGLRQEWENIDLETQLEIQDRWVDIILTKESM